MNQPLVSVVIPIYNVEKYLDRCVASVVGQTYTNLEIILVDDGSPDNCPTICDEWSKKDSRIKVIHKKNEGLGMARNTGIDNASGEYIFFFDSDDYVDTAIAEKCVRKIKEHNADVCIYGRYDLYDDGKLEEKRALSDKDYFDADSIKNQLLPGMFTYDMGFGVSSCGKMFRLDSIKRNGLRFKSEREIISEDTYFALEFFSRISSAVIVGDCLYYYYKRDNSLSRTFKKDRQEKNNYFLEKCTDFILKEGLPEAVHLHLKARYHSFTLAAIKQVYESALTSKEKKKELYTFFKDPVLCSTLDNEVLNLESSYVKLFFLSVKKKLYFVSCALLWLRSFKK
ncbi:MAG: glycosyltransferase family 2 protein [Clostridia bacterium]|nr:glycosyltransferase family 2 protein [Clostridia bacterium]MBQ7121486.1 glycosyltransferase family 2 protein [Clostridia bacterium]